MEQTTDCTLVAGFPLTPALVSVSSPWSVREEVGWGNWLQPPWDSRCQSTQHQSDTGTWNCHIYALSPGHTSKKHICYLTLYSLNDNLKNKSNLSQTQTSKSKTEENQSVMIKMCIPDSWTWWVPLVCQVVGRSVSEHTAARLAGQTGFNTMIVSIIIFFIS